MSLKGEQQAAFQDVVKQLYLSLKAIGSYPTDHPASLKPVKKTYQLFTALLKTQSTVTICVAQDTLLVENSPINRAFDFSAKLIRDLLTRNVSGLTFARGLLQQELKALLQVLSEQPEDLEKRGGIAKILSVRGISTIKITEINYSRGVGGSAGKDMQAPSVRGIVDGSRQGGFPSYPGGNGDEINGITGRHPETPGITGRHPETPGGMGRHPEINGIGEYILDEGPETSEDINSIASHMVGQGCDLEGFKIGMLSILSNLDKNAIARMCRDKGAMRRKKGDLIDHLCTELFYSATAESYVVESLRSGRFDREMLGRLLPAREQREKALPYVKEKIREYGIEEDVERIEGVFLKDETIEVSMMSLCNKEGVSPADESSVHSRDHGPYSQQVSPADGSSVHSRDHGQRVSPADESSVHSRDHGPYSQQVSPADGSSVHSRDHGPYSQQVSPADGSSVHSRDHGPYSQQVSPADGSSVHSRDHGQRVSPADGSSGLCLEDPHTLTLEASDDIDVKEVRGSIAPEIDCLTRHTEEIKEKVSAYLTAGRIDEARILLDHYGKRLDDQSWQIRKTVAEGFNAIVSGLDELDKVKENFREVSSSLINKLTARLKQEENIDTYLALTESLRMACSTEGKPDGYYVDETLGHRLYSDDKLSRQQLQQVLSTRKTSSRSIQYTVASLNYLDEKGVLHYLSEQFKGYSMLHLTELKNIPNNILETIPIKYAKRYYSLPFKLDDQKLYTALDNPQDMNKISDLEFITGYTIVPFCAAEYFLMNAIERFYDIGNGPGSFVEQAIEEIRQEDEGLEFIEEKEDKPAALDEYEGAQGPIVKMVNLILKEAVGKGASDIHIEPYEDEVRVRFRVDGSLIQAMKPPFKYRNGITSRIKVMSRLNISEKRLPQDGRFRIKVEGKCIDFRVSIFPGGFGEKVVLRLLDKSNLQIDMAKLGMKGEEMKALMGAMYKSKGMILVTGPTGSGKSTTLYSVLQKLNDGTRNINTAEDPVEYNIHGINQFQMNPAIGLDFARALRSFLRQDPDVIMVGEMRDLETAQIAVKAALTGHLVLSTLHTNSAAETITRLVEMGIEPFLVATSVDLIIAQRLMRTICPACRQETNPPQMQIDYLARLGVEVDTVTFYTGKGCEKCNDTGFKGRFAIYEVLPMWHEIREMIIRRESPLAIQKKAEELGLTTLCMSGLARVKQGITTIEELMRVAL